MLLLNWLIGLHGNRTHSRKSNLPKPADVQHHVGHRVECLEDRCVLSAASTAYSLADAIWFATVSGNVIAQSSSSLSGASVGSSNTGNLERQFLVRLTPEAVEQVDSPQQAQALFANSGAGLHVVRGLGLPGQLLVSTSERDSARVVAALQNNPHVAHFEEDSSVGAAQTFPNEQTQSSFFTDQYGLHNVGQNGGTVDADIDAPEAWDITTGSSQVIVSVIDSGVDFTHPDLYLNIWLNNAELPAPLLARMVSTDSVEGLSFRDLNHATNRALRLDPNNANSPLLLRDLNNNSYIDAADLLDDPLWSDGIDTDNNGFEDDLVGWDFQDNDNRPFDEHGHGTHVAGILGASGDNGIGVVGVNWTTSILPLRFLDENNTGDLADAIEAINYQTLLRTRETSPANIRVSNNSWGISGSLSQNLFDAVAATGEADILFVAAAGNGDFLGRGIDNDQTPFFPANLDLPNVISVGAFGPDGSLARFSNFGDQSVDIAAPGVGIVSAAPGGQYVSRNGTSMAASFVSGTAALLFAERLNATTAEVRDAIFTGAAHFANLDNLIVGGRQLNAFGALNASTFAPVATLSQITDITNVGGTQIQLNVTYTDDEGVSLSSLDTGDVVITRLGFSATRLVPSSVTLVGSGNSVTANYLVAVPGGSWDATDNSEYVVTLRAGQVADTSGIRTSQRELGRFRVAINDPSVFFVNTIVDSTDVNLVDGLALDAQGRTSLRAAIMQANATTGLNAIVLPDGVYALTLPGPDEDAAATGDLDVTDSLSLVGGGRTTAVIDANRIDRVLDVAEGVSFTLSEVTLRHGNANGSGGAIRNAGTATLTDVTLIDNSARTEGGGFHNQTDAVATLVRVSIDGNQTTDAFNVGGGGISNNGTLTLDSSSLVRNRSVGGLLRFELGGGGGLFNAFGGTATLVNATISTNTAVNGDGGGIYNAGTLHVSHTTVTENRAPSGDAGGIFNEDPPDLPVFLKSVAVMEPEGGTFYPGEPSSDLATDAGGRVYAVDPLNHRVQVFNPDGVFQFAFGHQGFDDGEFNEPSKLAVTPNGEIFVTDQTKRIQRFTSSGQFISSFTVTSITPPALAADANGLLYALDEQSNFTRKIVVFNPFGQIQNTITQIAGESLSNSTTHLAVAPNGTIATGDFEEIRIQPPTGMPVRIADDAIEDLAFNHSNELLESSVFGVITNTLEFRAELRAFNTSGTLLQTQLLMSGAGLGIVVPAVAAGTNGRTYLARSGAPFSIHVYDANGFVSSFGSYGASQYPGGVDVASDGTLFVANTRDHVIQVFDATGTLTRSFGSFGNGNGQLNSPTDIAVSGGNVVVSDTGNHRLQVFTKTGTFIRTIGSGLGSNPGQFNGPQRLAVDSSGRVYVADTGNHRIQVFESNGAFIKTIGSFGAGFGASLGQFNQPSGVAVSPDGAIFIADSGNNRVQRMSPNGDFSLLRVSSGSGETIFPDLDAITIDSQGNVYVTESSSDTIRVFDSHGYPRYRLGSTGDGIFSFSTGLLAQPIDLAESGGILYVAERDGMRISLLDANVLKRGSIHIANSIVASNFATSASDVRGSFQSNGANVIGIASGATGFADALAGTTLAPINAHLQPLTNAELPTHVPDVNSPALDAGTNDGAVLLDQLGHARPADAGLGLVGASQLNTPIRSRGGFGEFADFTSTSGEFGDFTSFNGDLYFEAGGGLFRSVSETNDIEFIAKVKARNFAEFDGKLYFVVTREQFVDEDIYSFDPVSRQITQLTDLHRSLSGLVPFNGELFFIAGESFAPPVDLYRLTLATNSVSLIRSSDGIAALIFEDDLYFRVSTRIEGGIFPTFQTEIFRYESGSGQLTLVPDFQDGISAGGRLFYIAGGHVLSRDRTTNVVTDLTPGLSASNLVLVGDRLYFLAKESGFNLVPSTPSNPLGVDLTAELYSLSALSPAAPRSIAVVDPRDDRSNPLLVVGGKLVLVERSNESPAEIHIYDTQTDEVRVSRTAVDPRNLTVVGSRIAFVAQDPTEIAYGVWFVDPAVAGAPDAGAIERYFVELDGNAFIDRNGNGSRDAGEFGLARRRVFVDVNQNGFFEPDEPSTLTRDNDPLTPATDETGQFQFTGLEPGNQLILLDVEAGLRITSPQRPKTGAATTIQAVTTTGLSAIDTTPALIGGRVFVNGTASLSEFLPDGDSRVIYATGTPLTGIVTGSPTLTQITNVVSDGTFVAFNARLSTTGKLASFLWDGSTLRLLSSEQTSLPEVSPSFKGDKLLVRDIEDGVVLLQGNSDVSSERGFFVSNTAGRIGSVANTKTLMPNSSTPVFTSLQPLGGSDGTSFAFSGTSGSLGEGVFVVQNGRAPVARVKKNDALPSGDDAFASFNGPIEIEGEHVFFYAQSTTGVRGIYRVDGDGHIRTVVDSQTEIPGRPGVRFVGQTGSITFDAPFGFAVSAGRVVFRGQADGGSFGFYLWDDGVITTLIDSSNLLDGQTITNLRFGPQSLSGNEFVFQASFGPNSNGVYKLIFNVDDFFEITIEPGRIQTDLNFGLHPDPGAVRGTVFVDADLDGQFDSGESLVANVTVLADLNNNRLRDVGEAITTTGANGQYLFNGLPGLETVRLVVIPPNDLAASSPTSSPGVQTIVTRPGQLTDRIDFALTTTAAGGRSTNGLVTGIVFTDANGNDLQDIDELGVGGVTVFVDENGDFVLNGGERSTVTAADGMYVLDQLRGTRQAVRVSVSETSGLRQVSPLGNQFTTATIGLQDSPVEVVSGDFDGDGDDDLAASIDATNRVRFFVNDGNGNFTPGVSVEVGVTPGSLAVGRFVSGSNRAGLVVGHRDSNSVRVLLPQSIASGSNVTQVELVNPLQTIGNGTFRTLGNGPYVVTTGNFDGDGDDDFAVASQNSGSDGAVAVFLSNGAGGFSHEQTLVLPRAVTNTPSAIVAAELNGDGRVDLAVAGLLSNSVRVLRNTGNAGAGRFALGESVAVGGNGPLSVQAGDLDNDGDRDLVTTNFGSDNVSILRNNGSGMFAAAELRTAGRGPAGARIVDLDRDGNLDIAFTNSEAANRFGVLRNRGGGMFQAAELSGLADLSNRTLAFSLAVGQFNDDNGDGAINSADTPDVVVSNRRDENIGARAGSLTTGRNTIVAGALQVEFTADVREVGGLNFALERINPPPTLNAIGNRTIDEDEPDASDRTVAFSGVTDGGDGSQALRVRASSSNTALFPSVSVSYVPGAASGSLELVPAANQNGTATISVEVTDAGFDGQFDTADDATTTQRFVVTVRPVNDAPVPMTDNVQVIAGSVGEFDVITNDEQNNPDAGESLRLLFLPPVAGQTAEIVNGARRVRYTAPMTLGPQMLSYVVTDNQATAMGQVMVQVIGADLTIDAGNDNLTVRSSNGRLEVLRNNVVDASFSANMAGAVSALRITGGSAAQRIDLSGVTRAAFSLAGGVIVTVQSGGGNDVVIGSEFHDSLDGGEGDDSLTGGLGNDTLTGGLGKDTLRGDAGDDCLIADLGDVGGTGNSTLDGGAGSDKLIVITNAGMNSDFVLAGSATTASLQFSTLTTAVKTTVLGLERAELRGGDGNNVLRASGFTGAVTLLGGNGEDSLDGGAAADSLDGGAGRDTLKGGNGNDTLVGEAGDLGGTLDGGGGTDCLAITASGVLTLTATALSFGTTTPMPKITLAGFEKVNWTGGEDGDSFNAAAFAFPVTLNGSGGEDILTGGSKEDVLLGGAGQDSLIGGLGRDSLDGQEGNDTLVGDRADATTTPATRGQLRGGNGDDLLQFTSDSAQTLTNAALFLATTTTATTSQITLDSFERAQLTGGAAGNAITAAALGFAFTGGPVTLSGGGGNDTLTGTTFADSLLGDAGNDLINGGDGDDTIKGGLNDDILSGGNGNDAILGNAGKDVLNGNDGRDTLIGGADNDTLRGGAQDDLLIGGSGVDSLDGESGNDTGLGGGGVAPRPDNAPPVTIGTLRDIITTELIDEAFANIFDFE